MNRKRRERNRRTASKLFNEVKRQRNAHHICENCGQPGGHWHTFPQSLLEIIEGKKPDGFFSCPAKVKITKVDPSVMLMSAPEGDSSLAFTDEQRERTMNDLRDMVSRSAKEINMD